MKPFVLYCSLAFLLIFVNVQVVQAEVEYRDDRSWPVDPQLHFNQPKGIAIDSTGYVYISDTGNHRIQKFRSDGTLLSTIGGGQLNAPRGIAVDRTGNLYVADTDANQIVKFSSAGTLIGKWGTPGAGNGQFNSPYDVSVDNSGNIYVADTGNYRIQKLSSTGDFIAKWGTRGKEDSEFCFPRGVAADPQGNIYVADSSLGTELQGVMGGWVKKFTSNGTYLFKWKYLGPYDDPNKYYGPKDDSPLDVSVDNAGNVYVTDWGVKKYAAPSEPPATYTNWLHGAPSNKDPGVTIDCAIDTTGNVFALGRWITQYDSSCSFVSRWGETKSSDIAVDGQGNIYAIDSVKTRVLKYSSTGTFLNSWGSHGSGPEQFIDPHGIAVDTNGNIYVADTGNCRISVFSPEGNLTNQWPCYHFKDKYGKPVEVTFGPQAITVDKAGYVHIGQLGSRSGRSCQKYSRNGVLISEFRHSDSPSSIAVDGAGNYYWPATSQFIRKYSPSGAFLELGWWHEWNGWFRMSSYSSSGIVFDDAGYAYLVPLPYEKIFIVRPDGSAIDMGPYPETGMYERQGMGIGVDNSGNVYIISPNLNFIRKICPISDSPTIKAVTPNKAISTDGEIVITVDGTEFGSGMKIQLVNSSLGTITGKFFELGYDTQARRSFTFVNAKPGLYDVVVTTPSGATARLEKGFRVLPIPVVLVHGWQSSPEVWDALTPELEKAGIPYWNFKYEMGEEEFMEWHLAGRLNQFIEEQRKACGYEVPYRGKFDIVCHSMGAIVTRYYTDIAGYDSRVRQWIGIAPAHGGSALADLQTMGPVFGGTTLLQSLGSSIFGKATQSLTTKTNVINYLKTASLRPSITYRVIAGWNPFHDVRFGYGALYRTRAKAPNGTYYWTFNGDMAIATEQSYREGMGFECFPDLSRGIGLNEPGYHFDHVHIHHSRAVINRVMEYLKNSSLDLVVKRPVDLNENEPYEISLIKTVADRILSGEIGHVVEHPFTILSTVIVHEAPDAVSSTGAVVNDLLFVDLRWTEGNLTLELTDPNGRRTTSATNTASAWSLVDSNHVLLTIASPAAGNWSAKIVPVSLPDHTIEYNLTMYRSKVKGTVGGEMPIVVTVPGGNGKPTDIDRDGRYDDVNGNGRKDFADVVLYFNQMTWIAANEPLAAFDYNGNGRVDFADVTWLFNNL